ncbi:DUF1150 family protein [Shumkonia mesophila]|uniref:DUF1150 family protein n=1 Tax=Shumkonia mesophila TaxID=2838854 RepID=UPI002934D216|nr:DUF1150 family protein [Shumkonia mesophila]
MHDKTSNNSSGAPLSRDLTLADFATLGVEDVAYVKPVVVNGAHAYAIHAANGQHLAVVPNRDLALATVRQNELEPVSVH